MKMKEANFFGNNQYTEVEIMSMTYDQLIEWGFTCDTTIEAQCVAGNKPTFTYTWKDGTNFTISRNANYENSGNAYNYYVNGYSMGSMRFNDSSASMASVKNTYVRLRLLYNDNEFILFIGNFPTRALSVPGGGIVGHMLDASGQYVDLRGYQSINSQPAMGILFDWVYFVKDGTSNRRVFKIPSLQTPASNIYIIDDYLITPNYTGMDHGNHSGMNSTQIVTTIPTLKACSYIDPNTTISLNGKTYLALDGCTLVELDNE